MALRDNLKYFRKKAGYRTGKDFANAIGIKVPTYMTYEAANRAKARWPSEEVLIKIASALRVSIDDLLGYHIPDDKEEKDTSEAVNHPDYYNHGIEVIDFVESHNLNFNRGSAIKYLVRAGLKCKDKEDEDIEKARWFVDRELERVRKAKKDG